MKEIVLIFVTFSLVTAHVTRDWSKSIPARKIHPTGHRQLAFSESTRIVGGNEAPRNSLRYQVGVRLLYNGATSFCGASLISRRYVLTAAHCLADDDLVSLEVLLGAHNISATESTQQRIPTTTFKIHEKYNRQEIANDLATVYLPTPANLNSNVQLIALPSRADVSNSFVGSQAVASGWGYNSQSVTVISDVLRYVNVPIIANNVCRDSLGSYVTNSIICTGGAGRKGVCPGDSGGPLVASGKLVGVTSFASGSGCEAGNPSAYSRVTAYLDWIAANSDVVIS
ncbi:brachyurin-like [Agrilus planipennis]|uniref:Brachyurin-like n=1 Tax=Agrilus planipennis TaxID=224129 RepID=A0A1W4XJG0_AGRPL|nr:brachyurin-like [Agrilus planipennis]